MGGGEQLVMSSLFRAATFAFCVGSTDATVTRQIDSLLRDLRTDEVPVGDLQVFTLLPSQRAVEPGRWDVSGPVVGAQAGLTLASAITLLVTGINLGALGSEPDRLHLHAGAAVRDGRAVILSAPRETGKTTTLTRLVLRGWGFISDEAVSAGPDDELVRGFPKPLSIKPHGRHLVPELETHTVPPLSEVEDGEVVHVPLGAVCGTPLPAARPHIVVFLRRPGGEVGASTATQETVHPADAVVRLMMETMDAGRYGARAVVELAELAARCRCYEVQVGDADHTAELIEQLADEPDGAALPVTELEVAGRISSRAVAVLVGDRVVVHEQPAGRILALDPTASQVWLALGGQETTEEIDLDGPVVARFVDQLVAMGLVVPAGQRPESETASP